MMMMLTKIQDDVVDVPLCIKNMCRSYVLVIWSNGFFNMQNMYRKHLASGRKVALAIKGASGVILVFFRQYTLRLWNAMQPQVEETLCLCSKAAPCEAGEVLSLLVVIYILFLMTLRSQKAKCYKIGCVTR